MKKALILFAATIVTFSTTSAFARNIWRECGIGGMIFTKTGWAAITSNIIWDWGTTATSSGVSSENLCEGPKASTAKFINENYANLEEETATGSGEHLSAMLNTMGCDSTVQNDIIANVRTDLQKSLASSEYTEKTETQKAEAYYNSVVQTVETKFAQNCENL